MFEGLTYEERQAWPVVRKLLVRKPELVAELLKDQSKESAVRVLLEAQKELNLLHAMAGAFAAAAKDLVNIEKEHKDARTQA